MVITDIEPGSRRARSSERHERTARSSRRSLGASILLTAVLFVSLLTLQGASQVASPTASVPDVIFQGNASNCNIAVDTAGNVHVSFYDEDSGSLMYAAIADGSWTTQVIAGPGAGREGSLAVDSRGNAHVSYVGNIADGYGDLMHATGEGGRWDAQVIDDGYVLGYSSIAIGPEDSVHISYHTGGSYENDNLRYATNASGSWSTEVVDTGQSGYLSSIAVASDGSVHISSYAGIGSKPLKYSTNAGGEWSTTNIEDAVWISGQSSIAVDSHGRPLVAISSSDEISQVDLKLVSNADNAWNSEAIAFGGYVCGRSLALGPQDAVHMCYRSYPEYELMYATNEGGPWSTRAVGDMSTANAHGSIAVDAGGIAHVCYIGPDGPDARLMYAKLGNAGGGPDDPAGAADQGSNEHVSTIPSPPTNLAVMPDDGSVRLTWDAPDDGSGPITGYMVYRGTDRGDMITIATVNGTGYVDSGVQVGPTFYYRVVAVNSEGVSGSTDAVNVTLASTYAPVASWPAAMVIGGIVLAGLAAAALTIVILVKRRPER